MALCVFFGGWDWFFFFGMLPHISSLASPLQFFPDSFPFLPRVSSLAAPPEGSRRGYRRFRNWFGSNKEDIFDTSTKRRRLLQRC